MGDRDSRRLTVNMKVNVKEQMLADIICIAMEGGIGYWLSADEYHTKGLDDGHPDTVLATVREIDDNGEPTGDAIRITTNTIYAGICIMLLDDSCCRDDIRRIVQMSLVDPDNAADIDSEVADVIVQLGLFGRLVYG